MYFSWELPLLLLSRDKIHNRDPICNRGYRILRRGGSLKVCGICCKKRGITEEILLDFIPIGSMGDFVETAAVSDVHLMF